MVEDFLKLWIRSLILLLLTFSITKGLIQWLKLILFTVGKSIWRAFFQNNWGIQALLRGKWEEKARKTAETLSLGSEVFVRRTSTGRELFCVLICLDAPNLFCQVSLLLKTRFARTAETRLKRAKSSLPVDVRAQNVAAFLKDALFSLSRRHS